MKGLHGLIFFFFLHLGLRELTERRSPASVPFGGRYRIIDFMLSSMVNAGIDDVGIILQSNYQSLLDHVGSGKDWDLSRKHGGLRLLPPFHMDQCRGDMGYRGRMEALASVASYLEKIRQDHVVLANGDTVINIPLQKVYELVREHVTPYTRDRFMSPDIKAVHKLVKENKVWETVLPYIEKYQQYEKEHGEK